MLSNKILFALTATVAASVAFNTQALDLQAAVDKTLNENPELQIALNDREAIAHEIRQAFGGYLPRIDFDAGWGWEQSDNSTTRGNFAAGRSLDSEASLMRRELGLRATQSLYNGGQTKYEVQREKARFLGADARVREVAEDLTLRAIEAYLEVRRDRELVALAQQSLDRHMKYVSEIESLNRAGRGSIADVEQAKGRTALAESRKLQAEGALRTSEAKFFSVIGENATMLDTTIQAPIAALPTSVEDAIELAVSNHPRLRTGAARVGAAEAEVKIAHSTFFPRLNLEVSATDNRNLDGSRGDSDDVMAMLRLRYNLYNGGQDAAEKQENYARMMATRDALDTDRRSVEQNSRVAWSEYVTANARLAPLQRHAESSEQSRTAYNEQFTLGQRTLLDLLDAEDEVFNSRAEYLTGVNARDFAAFRVLNATGQLLDNLGVSLPVPQKSAKVAAAE
jgi:adhesin transport system outer membrane protein